MAEPGYASAPTPAGAGAHTASRTGQSRARIPLAADLQRIEHHRAPGDLEMRPDIAVRLADALGCEQRDDKRPSPRQGWIRRVFRALAVRRIHRRRRRCRGGPAGADAPVVLHLRAAERLGDADPTIFAESSDARGGV